MRVDQSDCLTVYDRGLFVSHLWAMGLNVLGYQSHLLILQRCHPVCGH